MILFPNAELVPLTPQGRKWHICECTEGSGASLQRPIPQLLLARKGGRVVWCVCLYNAQHGRILDCGWDSATAEIINDSNRFRVLILQSDANCSQKGWITRNGSIILFQLDSELKGCSLVKIYYVANNHSNPINAVKDSREKKNLLILPPPWMYVGPSILYQGGSDTQAWRHKRRDKKCKPHVFSSGFVAVAFSLSKWNWCFASVTPAA